MTHYSDQDTRGLFQTDINFDKSLFENIIERLSRENRELRLQLEQANAKIARLIDAVDEGEEV